MFRNNIGHASRLVQIVRASRRPYLFLPIERLLNWTDFIWLGYWQRDCNKLVSPRTGTYRYTRENDPLTTVIHRSCDFLNNFAADDSPIVRSKQQVYPTVASYPIDYMRSRACNSADSNGSLMKSVAQVLDANLFGWCARLDMNTRNAIGIYVANRFWKM